MHQGVDRGVVPSLSRNSPAAVQIGLGVNDVIMKIDDAIFDDLLARAGESPRRRLNFDLRNSPEDGSQRMLNALLPETVVPVHRHHASSETVVLLRGSVAEIFFDDDGAETERVELKVGDVLQIERDRWHTIVAHCPSVIFEAKDGAFRPLAEDEVR